VARRISKNVPSGALAGSPFHVGGKPLGLGDDEPIKLPSLIAFRSFDGLGSIVEASPGN
jgi:hypothetical protein